MNKVYIWDPRPTGFWSVDRSGQTHIERPGINVGHAAFDISLNQGLGKAEYVSWWPYGGKTTLWAKGGFQTFMDDCKAEGSETDPRLPDRTLDFGGLDEDKMRAKWYEIKANSNYQIFYQNCAASIADILRAGGADMSAEVRYRMRQVIIWTPWDLYEVAQMIQQRSSKIEKLRAQGKAEDGLDVMLMHMPH